MSAPLGYALTLLVRPFATWRAIASERISFPALAFGYVLPLIAIGPIATFFARHTIGLRVGHVVYRASVGEAFTQAAFALGYAVVGLGLVALLVFLLAPVFGAKRDLARAFRVTAFAFTPVWLAAVVVLLPWIGFVELLALAYEIFLLHAGVAALLDVSRGRAGGLAACSVLGAVLIAVGFAALSAMLAGGG